MCWLCTVHTCHPLVIVLLCVHVLLLTFVIAKFSFPLTFVMLFAWFIAEKLCNKWSIATKCNGHLCLGLSQICSKFCPKFFQEFPIIMPFKCSYYNLKGGGQGGPLKLLNFWKYCISLDTEFTGNLPELTRRRHGPMFLQSKEDYYIFFALL